MIDNHYHHSDNDKLFLFESNGICLLGTSTQFQLHSKVEKDGHMKDISTKSLCHSKAVQFCVQCTWKSNEVLNSITGMYTFTTQMLLLLLCLCDELCIYCRTVSGLLGSAIIQMHRFVLARQQEHSFLLQIRNSILHTRSAQAWLERLMGVSVVTDVMQNMGIICIVVYCGRREQPILSYYNSSAAQNGLV